MPVPDGWPLVAEALYPRILDRLPQKALGVEVGVWLGASAMHMARLIRDSGKDVRFYAVDHFQGNYSEPNHLRWADELKRAGTSLEEECRRRIGEAGLDDYVTLMPVPSVQASLRFPDRSLDFVYLDGDHTEEGVQADLEAWAPKVRVGGILAGDDYAGTRLGDFPGVRAAVNRFFGLRCVEVVKEAETGWAVWSWV